METPGCIPAAPVTRTPYPSLATVATFFSDFLADFPNPFELESNLSFGALDAFGIVANAAAVPFAGAEDAGVGEGDAEALGVGVGVADGVDVPKASVATPVSTSEEIESSLNLTLNSRPAATFRLFAANVTEIVTFDEKFPLILVAMTVACGVQLNAWHMPPARSLVTCPVEQDPLGLFTKDHPTGILTKKVSAPPTVTKVAETTIGVALVPVVPISPAEVAVAPDIVAALAGAVAKPRVSPTNEISTSKDLTILFTVFLENLLQQDVVAASNLSRFRILARQNVRVAHHFP